MLEQLLAEMNEVSSELDSLDESDPRRARLSERQVEIRNELRRFDFDRSRPLAEVETELNHLRSQLKAAQADRIGPMKGRSSSDEGRSWKKAFKISVVGEVRGADINRRIDENNRVADLRARVEHLETVVAERRGNGPSDV